MNAADPPLRTAPPALDDADDTEDRLDDATDEPETEATDQLSEETGIDLTDASELDADNVPADEEHDRVVQAPD